jgi:hypothetical protein
LPTDPAATARTVGPREGARAPETGFVPAMVDAPSAADRLLGPGARRPAAPVFTHRGNSCPDRPPHIPPDG